MLSPKLTEHFTLIEFLPEQIWNQFGESGIWFIDMRVVVACEKIRSFFKVPLIVNDWHTGGQYNLSGYRPPDSAIGAKFSQHKFGRAGDIKVKGVSDPEVRDAIRVHYREWGITCIEKDTVGWVHIDVRHTGSEELLQVNMPK